MKSGTFYLLILLAFAPSVSAFAQNPFIRNQFTADPSARVFGDRVYVYPSHDIPCTEEKGRIGWFCMEDYHVFSSSDLTNWTDHGMIVSQENVPWADPNAYSMWAPDCIQLNGKYLFYFPTKARDTTYNGDGFSIGVAIADKPTGPFVPQPKPIANVKGIDPNIFIDHDGQAYLYWSQGHLYGAKLKEDGLELASEPQILTNFPDKGLKEGPYLFERNGIYYMTYPHVADKTERLEYAVGDNPLGPFEFKGVIMDESPTGCWTNHQSIVSFKDQWYLFYHHNDLSPNFDKNRSIKVDSLFFENDGTIRKVIPSLRGVGITDIAEKIEVDRYSKVSEQGTTLEFLDSLHTFKGWQVSLLKKGAWVQYNSVNFGEGKASNIIVRANSAKGATVVIRSGNSYGPVLAKVKIRKGRMWGEYKATVNALPRGIGNLVLSIEKDQPVAIDWVQFAN